VSKSTQALVETRKGNLLLSIALTAFVRSACKTRSFVCIHANKNAEIDVYFEMESTPQLCGFSLR